MSEITEQILEGFLCEECTAYIDGDKSGYPRKCSSCKPKKRKKNKKSKQNFRK